MKTCTLLLLLVTISLGSLAAANDKLNQTSARVNDLLARRLEKRAFVAGPNPFQLPGVRLAATTPSTSPTTSEPAADPRALLDAYVADLRINGVVQHNGRPHLLINASLYSTGDFIQVRDDPPEYLRIVNLTPRELTLALGDAQVTIQVTMR